ncbi:MAG TPA: ATP-binding cassette domain-containing protein [Candidatus Acidoferrales bacterium]
MSDPAEEAIRFEGVSLAFGDNEVLRGLSFRVARGETLVLIGATASGKTLTLKLALGLLKPTRGRIFILGHDITEMEEEDLFPLREQLGIVFQEMALFDSLTVYENVAYRLIEETIHGDADFSDEEIERRVRQVLSFVDLEDAIWKMPAELSGGMKRRVSIARALITEPPVILYDSPTAGLDPVTSQTILTLIARLRDTRQTTSLMVTHRLQDAFILASNVYDEATHELRPVSTNGGPARRLVRRSPFTPSAATRNEGEGEGGSLGEGGRAVPPTRFLLLRDGGVYFDGAPAELLAAGDEYVQRFLA